MAAIGAAQAQEAMRQNSAFEESVELVFDELRQASASYRLSLNEEALGVLLHQAVQRGRLEAVAPEVDRCAIAMRPAGLAGVGLHVMGTGSLGWCSFSGRALQRIRHWGDHLRPVPQQCRMPGINNVDDAHVHFGGVFMVQMTETIAYSIARATPVFALLASVEG